MTKATLRFEYVEEIDHCERGIDYLEDPTRYDGVEEPHLSQYLREDAERLAAFHRGDWWMIGIRARAIVTVGDVVIGHTSKGPCLRDFDFVAESSGLWGIESDSGDDYRAEMYEEQIAELADALHALGFSHSDIAAAPRRVGVA